MIPLAIPDLSGNEARYLRECVDSTFVSSVGPFVTRFEEMVAAYACAPLGVAVASGTAALHTALTAVGVARDDLVIVPSLTFVATANAVAYCGAEPWLMDVDPGSWTLDPRQLEEALETETEPATPGGRRHKATGRVVRCVLPVYTLGMPAEMDAIVAIAARFGLPVVADAAAALGATLRSRPLGALGATLTTFSFNGNKTITAGGGGAIVGADEGLVTLCRHLSTTARVGQDYDHDRVGFNYRMTNIQAAVGCAQMERADQLVAAKRRIDAGYRAAFGDHPRLGLFPKPDWAESACWFSGVVVAEGDAGELRGWLRADGIDARPFWKPMHLQAAFRACPRTSMSVSEDLWRRILTLPCSAGLTAAEQDAVVTAVRRRLG